MALQAKFMKMGKGGTLAIYEVRGTSADVSDFVKNNYKDREPAFKSSPNGEPILDSSGNKVALYFTSYPMPGKNMWHPMYKVLMGDNAGSYTLDKADLQFEMLVTKSTGGDFGQAYAADAVKRYTSSAPISSSAAALADDDDDTDEEDFTASDTAEAVTASVDADMDALPAEEAPKTTVTAKAAK
tara:strand:- start:1629 stop:2183 length:555 start_codon:yes stop_codon:yes gene_type:complete